MPGYRPKGSIILARQLLDSEIYSKPASWLKIWIHILLNVDYKDSEKGRRGTGYFRVPEMSKELGINEDVIHNCIKWLRKTTMVQTQKTTRGVYISVCKYGRFQDPALYKNQTENHSRTTLYVNKIINKKENSNGSQEKSGQDVEKNKKALDQVKAELKKKKVI